MRKQRVQQKKKQISDNLLVELLALSKANESFSKKLGRFMGEIERLLKVTGKVLYLYDFKDDKYFSVSLGSSKKREFSLKSPIGLVGEAIDRKEILIIGDAQKHDKYSKTVDLPLKPGEKSIACVPLIMGKKTVAVAEFRAKSFDKKSLEGASPLFDLMALTCAHEADIYQIDELTITDDLTGLGNARHLAKMVEMEIRRSLRYKSIFSLIFIDLDKFKSVNDVHGHLTGSRVLVESAEAFASSLRQDVDMAFRYGGDEFVVFLPATNKEGAVAVADRLRYIINARTFKSDSGISFNISASFGIAAFPEDAHTREEIMKLADEAMYDAKKRGRNTVSTT